MYGVWALMCALDLVKDKATKESLSTIPGAAAKLSKRMIDNGLWARVTQFLFVTPTPDGNPTGGG